MTESENAGPEQGTPLPCPFCGGNVHVEEPPEIGAHLWNLCCDSAGCPANGSLLAGSTPAELIAAWNRREPLRVAIEEIERARDAANWMTTKTGLNAALSILERSRRSPSLSPAPAIEALRRIHDLVHDGDMPDYANLPQVDLASCSYVKLASLVDEVAPSLSGRPLEEAPDDVLTELVAVAHAHGWNGVENSKLLVRFFDNALLEADMDRRRVRKLSQENTDQRHFLRGHVDTIDQLREQLAASSSSAPATSTATNDEQRIAEIEAKWRPVYRVQADDVRWLINRLRAASRRAPEGERERDTQRLNWLEKNAMREDADDAAGIRIQRFSGSPQKQFADAAFRLRTWGETPTGDDGELDYSRRYYGHSNHTSLREAIDAAMRASRSGTEGET